YRIREPQQQELLDVIIRNAKRLQRLTENILDVTKIESHSLNLKKEPFNLKDVLTNTIDDITVNIVRNKERLDDVKLVYQPRDIFIEADKARITQVVSNLLSNAVKFTETSAKGERRGIINVNIESDDSVAVVSIEDSGTGIDPEIKPRLFDKFASKSYQGTGLGLFISKSIVEAHSGRIWAHNNPDGKGATFSFSLPIRNIITTNQQNYT
ncbi:MAG TPA: ATP-binding protein, partial [Nitrososphaeraceae archaeon]|nr:ATP-binding protein [Nitrososphaeraceae archaeon]